MAIYDVGIVINYGRRDRTHVAVRLCQFLRRLGLSVSLYSPKPPSRAIDSECDGLVVSTFERHLVEWALACRLVIWVTPPNWVDEIQAVRSAGIGTMMILARDLVHTEATDAAIRAVHVVVIPHQASLPKKSLSGKLDLVHIPWASGLPVSTRSRGSGGRHVRVLLALQGCQAKRSDMADASIAAVRLLSRCSHAQATILVTPDRISAFDKSLMRRLFRSGDFDGRMRLRIDETGFREAPWCYLDHDLTVWPAWSDGFGLIGLESQRSGCPLVGYDTAPLNEFLMPGRSGVMVEAQSCPTYPNLAVSPSRDDLLAFIDTVVSLVDHPEVLGHMSAESARLSDAREREFRLGWEKVLKRFEIL